MGRRDRVRHGAGIAAEHLGKVMDPFFTTKEVGRGTGLGLAICQSIVEQHGGTIQIQSAGVNKGTTVIVRLPAVCREGTFDGTTVRTFDRTSSWSRRTVELPNPHACASRDAIWGSSKCTIRRFASSSWTTSGRSAF